jgi:hypothetical protein
VDTNYKGTRSVHPDSEAQQELHLVLIGLDVYRRVAELAST